MVPSNELMPLGSEFTMRAYVNSLFSGSKRGFIVFLNSAPIFWFSKKQGSCETSTGSKFVSMKQCCEYVRGLRYKIRIIGISVNNPVFTNGDNQSMLWNTEVPDSTLKNKSSVVAYQFVREGLARTDLIMGYIKTSENCLDFMTNTVSPEKNIKRNIGQLIMKYIQRIMWAVFE